MVFGNIIKWAGGAAKKFGEVAGEGLKKFGSVKSAYNSVNNAFGGVLGRAIESIPMAGPILKGIGQFLDNKESMKKLVGTIEHAKVYGQDFEKIGNRMMSHSGG